MGPVERAVERTVVAAEIVGLISPDLNAAQIEAARAAARAADGAESAGAAGYALAVLSKCLAGLGLDAKNTRRVVESVDQGALAVAVARRLGQPSELRAVEA